jgi:hypothetical protein
MKKSRWCPSSIATCETVAFTVGAESAETSAPICNTLALLGRCSVRYDRGYLVSALSAFLEVP